MDRTWTVWAVTADGETIEDSTLHFKSESAALAHVVEKHRAGIQTRMVSDTGTQATNLRWQHEGAYKKARGDTGVPKARTDVQLAAMESAQKAAHKKSIGTQGDETYE